MQCKWSAKDIGGESNVMNFWIDSYILNWSYVYICVPLSLGLGLERLYDPDILFFIFFCRFLCSLISTFWYPQALKIFLLCQLTDIIFSSFFLSSWTHFLLFFFRWIMSSATNLIVKKKEKKNSQSCYLLPRNKILVISNFIKRKTLIHDRKKN